MKPRLLLHLCCAPCATVAIKRLENKFDLWGFFFNPNIYPRTEYDCRLESVAKLARAWQVKLLPAPPYDQSHWLSKVFGLENEPEGGQRCRQCYYFRLLKTAQVAQKYSFPFFTTTLTLSPHKESKLINQIGGDIAASGPEKFISENFKTQDGFRESLQYSRDLDLYRQKYCGCQFSLRA